MRDDGLEAVIAGAMVRHRHLSKDPCGDCVLAVARAVRGWQPPQWPPPRPVLDLRRPNWSTHGYFQIA